MLRDRPKRHQALHADETSLPRPGRGGAPNWAVRGGVWGLVERMGVHPSNQVLPRRKATAHHSLSLCCVPGAL